MTIETLKRVQQGFTLIELLVVIGILAVLLAITLIAINPAKQFQQANDTKRRSDVNAILNAVNQYMADHKGALPAGVTNADQEITDQAANICSDIVPEYIAALPVDPLENNGAPVTNCGAAYTTRYHIIQGANNRITVTATGEIEPVISVTR